MKKEMDSGAKDGGDTKPSEGESSTHPPMVTSSAVPAARIIKSVSVRSLASRSSASKLSDLDEDEKETRQATLDTSTPH